MISSPFLTGYASDVWVQRETTMLGPSIENAYTTNRLTGYSIQANTVNRLTKVGPSWRRSKSKALQSTVLLTLKFELRATSAILELLRSLLSLANLGTDPLTGIETRTFEPDFVDMVHTMKVWIRDANTGEGFLHEGCAVSDCQIDVVSRGLSTIQFSLIALKTGNFSSISFPPVLLDDVRHRHNYTAQFSGIYFSQDGFANPITTYPFIGVTRIGLIITRQLEAAQFSKGQASRFLKSPPEFSGTFDCYIDSYVRSLLMNADNFGNAVIQFGESHFSFMQALLQSVGLTFDQASLHSSASENSATGNLTTQQDLTVTAGVVLSLIRIAEGFDGGELFENDLPQPYALDGGDFFSDFSSTDIDGGDMSGVFTGIAIDGGAMDQYFASYVDGGTIGIDFMDEIDGGAMAGLFSGPVCEGGSFFDIYTSCVNGGGFVAAFINPNIDGGAF